MGVVTGGSVVSLGVVTGGFCWSTGCGDNGIAGCDRNPLPLAQPSVQCM